MSGTSQDRSLRNATWRKSSFSESLGACVEVSSTDGGFAVRDSKNPYGPVMRPVVKGWAAFIGRVSVGELGLPS